MDERLRVVDEDHRKVLRIANNESQKHPYHIRKTKNFYELKMKGEEEIDGLTRRVQDLEKEVQKEKDNYQNAMNNLEKISSEVY